MYAIESESQPDCFLSESIIPFYTIYIHVGFSGDWRSEKGIQVTTIGAFGWE